MGGFASSSNTTFTIVQSVNQQKIKKEATLKVHRFEAILILLEYLLAIDTSETAWVMKRRPRAGRARLQVLRELDDTLGEQQP